jgi:hypothetical protein
MSTHVLVMLVDGTGAHVLRVAPTVDSFRSLIGGWLEAIHPINLPTNVPPWHAYLDEEGKLKALPRNVPATRIAQAAGWAPIDILCGPVIFVGDGPPSDPSGESSVPAVLVTLARPFLPIIIQDHHSLTRARNDGDA